MSGVGPTGPTPGGNGGAGRDVPRLPSLPQIGVGRLNIFVPAIMSVGLLFWIVTLARDLFRWRGRQELERRSRLAGRGIADFVHGPGRPAGSLRPGLRPRRSYLLTGVVLLAIAAYVLIGSASNYVRADSYVGDVAWLLGLALLVSVAFGFAGGVAAAVFLAWPDPPRGLTRILVSTPFTRTPQADDDDPDLEPSWGLSVAAMLTPLAAVVMTIVVATSADRLRSVDRPAARRLAETDLFAIGTFLDPTSQPIIAILLAAVVALAAWRCRPLAIAAVVVVALAAVASLTARAVAGRVGPGDTGTLSFPNGATTVAVMALGLVPMSVGILFRSHRWIGPARALSGLFAAAVALAAVQDRQAWLTDVVGGALVGASVAFAVEWVVDHRRWHAWCHGCPWAPPGRPHRLLERIHLGEHHLTVSAFAHLGALVAVVVLTVLTLTGGVPENSDGSLLGEPMQRAVQLGVAVVVSLGALLSWKWPGLGAVMIAVAGAVLGVFAGLEYRPEVAVLWTLGLLIPALLLWLSWQHHRVRAEIVVLAVVTVALLGGTWGGAGQVYAHYFGPTHPDSAAPSVDVDRVRWSWSGALDSDRVSVVAGIVAGYSTARLRLRPAGGGDDVWSPLRTTGDADLIRLDATGLTPATTYLATVEVNGRLDAGRGNLTVRTPGVGPQSFTVAVGACARVGTNGAVFDEIARHDPLMFLALGDLHYGNLDSTDPAPFRAAWERILTQPGPAALFRRVPVAYVWDDHDYGPNDADATAPSRPAARTAYRGVTPHYPLASSTGSIEQAFTVGRVRFVLTDTRSERIGDTMLGSTQLEWLLNELTTAARTHAVVVWANAVPWVGEATAGSDSWAGYPAERQRISDAIAAAEIENLVMLSGDAHMVAIDDGTNTDYSAAGQGGFPLLHAAALDRRGSVKGGPYSEGTFPGGGQFGTFEVTDDGGDEVSVRLRGLTWEGRELVSHEVRIAVPEGARAE